MHITYETEAGSYSINSRDDAIVDTVGLPHGSYCQLPLNAKGTSQYSGFHILQDTDQGWDVFKFLYDLVVENLQTVTKSIEENKTTLVCAKGKVTYEVLENGLSITNDFADYTVRLDCRKLYDYSTEGRSYVVRQHNSDTIIEYTKYVDGSNTQELYKQFAVVRCNNTLSMNGNWQEQYHDYDALRGNEPQHWYVYNAFTVPQNSTLRIGFGFTLDQAYGFTERPFKNHQLTAAPTIMERNDVPAAIKTAYVASVHGVQQLLVERVAGVGLFAGLPWFFHWWTRDEAISLDTLFALDNQYAFKSILMRQLQRIDADGRVPNRFPHADLGCADGTGWLFVQARQALTALKKDSAVHAHFSTQELTILHDATEKYIDGIARQYLVNNLVVSQPDETWMDTSYGGDVRQGACIEIQALYLNALQLMHELDAFLGRPKNEVYEKQYLATLHACAQFYSPSKGLADCIKDGNPDFTQRPNIFLAAYIYPSLLEAEQWSTVFDIALEKLWCQWGGLASISKSHELYTAYYTPLANKSYHRGDSWYWVNAIAAMVLQKNDPVRFSKFISAIRDASTSEILSGGALGHHAEVSSAIHMEARGCFAQLWSSAMYILLIHELYG